MKKSIILASAVAVTLGMMQTAPFALAHGHGGGHHGGGHHGGGGHNHGGHNNVNINYHDHDHHDDGDFWGGAAVGAMVGYGLANSNDPCRDPQYRADYPGNCQGY